MWTIENRVWYDRSKLRYPSDPADEEWSLIETMIPHAKLGGNKRTVNVESSKNPILIFPIVAISIGYDFFIRAEKKVFEPSILDGFL